MANIEFVICWYFTIFFSKGKACYNFIINSHENMFLLNYCEFGQALQNMFTILFLIIICSLIRYFIEPSPCSNCINCINRRTAICKTKGLRTCKFRGVFRISVRWGRYFAQSVNEILPPLWDFLRPLEWYLLDTYISYSVIQ